MIDRLVAIAALLVAVTTLALLILFMDATGNKLQDMEAPIPAWNGPAERRA